MLAIKVLNDKVQMFPPLYNTVGYELNWVHFQWKQATIAIMQCFGLHI